MGALAWQRSAAAQATPTTEGGEGGPLLVQSFSQGSLFPTQGDADGAPYTVILWDAADRGFFFADCTVNIDPDAARHAPFDGSWRAPVRSRSPARRAPPARRSRS